MSLFKKSYQDRLDAEITHYEEVFKGNLLQSVPPSWRLVEKVFSQKIKKATGANGIGQYLAKYFTGQPQISLLGLGSGACGPELEGIVPQLQKNQISVELSCLDINRQSLNLARREAQKRQVTFHQIVADINSYSFPQNKFNAIVAHASLHHFDNLDHVAQGINQALKPEGIFLTVDIPTRNGYLMWPETFKLVKQLWHLLPPKFKIDHTKHAQPLYAPKYENVDYSKTSFECTNSEKILPTLRCHLREIVFVPGMAICRRFLDTKFGPNYDLKVPLDKALATFILEYDTYLLDHQILKPETFFGVYQKK